jgi:hypothetical protein
MFNSVKHRDFMLADDLPSAECCKCRRQRRDAGAAVGDGHLSVAAAYGTNHRQRAALRADDAVARSVVAYYTGGSSVDLAILNLIAVLPRSR